MAESDNVRKIEQLIDYIRSKYPGNMSMQGKGMQSLKRTLKETGSPFLDRSFNWNGYKVTISVTPIENITFGFWDLYDSRGIYLGSGVDRCDIGSPMKYYLLFSSTSVVREPLIKTWIEG